MPKNKLSLMFESIFRRDVLSDDTHKLDLTVDVHAHILPQLDDGPVDIEQSIEIIKEMYAMGYRKIIVTPHVMTGYYNNAPKIFYNRSKFSEMYSNVEIFILS